MKQAFRYWLWTIGSAFAHSGHAVNISIDIARAVADPARPSAQVELDQWRNPAEVIAFAGLKRGDKIADFMSGGGYFTRLFSKVVGPLGRVYAFLPTQELTNCAPEETAGTKALEQDVRYKNVRITIEASERFSAPEALDMVWTSQNYHDLHDKFMAPTDTRVLNAAIFRALKPGGVFVVIDHIAEPGSGLRDTETLHRIDPQTIRSEVTAAGFVLEAQSDLLRNGADSHALPVFDPAIRHRTDQVILKFRKPERSSPIVAGKKTAIEMVVAGRLCPAWSSSGIRSFSLAYTAPAAELAAVNMDIDMSRPADRPSRRARAKVA